MLIMILHCGLYMHIERPTGAGRKLKAVYIQEMLPPLILH